MGERELLEVAGRQLQRTGRAGFTLDVRANPRRKDGVAYLDGTLCLTDVASSARTGTVTVDVPRNCLPHGAGVLRVTTYTAKRNGSGPGYSEDTMRVKGRVSLG